MSLVDVSKFYADLYRRILSDALLREAVIVIVILLLASKWTHVALHLCVFLEIYLSEPQDVQVDGSLVFIVAD